MWTSAADARRHGAIDLEALRWARAADDFAGIVRDGVGVSVWIMFDGRPAVVGEPRTRNVDLLETGSRAAFWSDPVDLEAAGGAS